MTLKCKQFLFLIFLCDIRRITHIVKSGNSIVGDWDKYKSTLKVKSEWVIGV